MEAATRLIDNFDPTALPSPLVIVEALLSEVTIRAEGFGGTHLDPSFAPIVSLQWEEGKLRLIVYADVNDETPTHEIDLSGALESNRREVDVEPQTVPV